MLRWATQLSLLNVFFVWFAIHSLSFCLTDRHHFMVFFFIKCCSNFPISIIITITKVEDVDQLKFHSTNNSAWYESFRNVSILHDSLSYLCSAIVHRAAFFSPPCPTGWILSSRLRVSNQRFHSLNALKVIFNDYCTHLRTTCRFEVLSCKPIRENETSGLVCVTTKVHLYTICT